MAIATSLVLGLFQHVNSQLNSSCRMTSIRSLVSWWIDVVESVKAFENDKFKARAVARASGRVFEQGLCYWTIHGLALRDEMPDDDLENDIVASYLNASRMAKAEALQEGDGVTAVRRQSRGRRTPDAAMYEGEDAAEQRV